MHQVTPSKNALGEPPQHMHAQPQPNASQICTATAIHVRAGTISTAWRILGEAYSSTSKNICSIQSRSIITMAEALGIAGSIAGLAQLSVAVFQGITKFYREAKDAGSSVNSLATQTRNLAGVLQNLSLLASSLTPEDEESYVSFRAPYIGACFSTLRKIENKIQRARDDFSSDKRRKVITRSLKWPFSIDETNTLITELGNHRDNLGLALSADSLRTLLECLSTTKDIDNSLNALQDTVAKKFSIDTRLQLDEHRQVSIECSLFSTLACSRSGFRHASFLPLKHARHLVFRNAEIYKSNS